MTAPRSGHPAPYVVDAEAAAERNRHSVPERMQRQHRPAGVRGRHNVYSRGLAGRGSIVRGLRRPCTPLRLPLCCVLVLLAFAHDHRCATGPL
jgi:hypothetical protein